MNQLLHKLIHSFKVLKSHSSPITQFSITFLNFYICFPQILAIRLHPWVEFWKIHPFHLNLYWMLASASETAEMRLMHELSWHIWWLEEINSGQLIFFPFWWHFLLPRYTLQLIAITVPQPLCAPALHSTLQYILSQFIPILQVKQAW